MLQELQPRFFSELVKISAFSHGTGAWEGNAQKLISRGVCTLNEVAATRDNVMMYLIRKGIDPLHAFQIMESVRKGNGILPKTIKILQKNGVPFWYIQSCKKMGYIIELLELAQEMYMRGHHLRPHFYDEYLKSF